MWAIKLLQRICSCWRLTESLMVRSNLFPGAELTLTVVNCTVGSSQIPNFHEKSGAIQYYRFSVSPSLRSTAVLIARRSAAGRWKLTIATSLSSVNLSPPFSD
jgi:hypothetical protein